MASKRAKKHRQIVKQQQEQKARARGRLNTVSQQVFSVSADIRKQIAKANTRLLRLEQAGLINEIYTQTTNTLGRSRFTLPKTPEEQRKTALILGKFLGAKTSTVKAARAVNTKNRQDFAEFLKRASQGKLSKDVINIVSSRMGDLNLRELIKLYTYNEIVDAVIELEDSGINATSDNVSRALATDIDSVIEDELQRRGVNVSSDVMGVAVAIARGNGIDVALDYISELGGGNK